MDKPLLLLLLGTFVVGACSGDHHGNAPSDTGVDTAPADTGVDAGDPCLDPSGCFACPPSTTPEFLEACTASECAPFDNNARIPGFLP